jgi:hypothetical protein
LHFFLKYFPLCMFAKVSVFFNTSPHLESWRHFCPLSTLLYSISTPPQRYYHHSLTFSPPYITTSTVTQFFKLFDFERSKKETPTKTPTKDVDDGN